MIYKHRVYLTNALLLVHEHIIFSTQQQNYDHKFSTEYKYITYTSPGYKFFCFFSSRKLVKIVDSRTMLLQVQFVLVFRVTEVENANLGEVQKLLIFRAAFQLEEISNRV